MDSLSVRRLTENEVFFKRPNEQVVKGLTELQELAEAADQEYLLHGTDQLIQFYCECSDEKCRKRVALSANQYTDLHKNDNQFVVLPGHNVPEIESIIATTDNYVVVEKYTDSPSKVTTPHSTNLDKS